MKDITTILESLLDDDFDVSSDHIIGWAIWLEFLTGVSGLKGYAYASKAKYRKNIEPKLLESIFSLKKLGKTEALNESKYPCVAYVMKSDINNCTIIEIHCQGTVIQVNSGHLSAGKGEKRFFEKFRGWEIVGFWEFPVSLFEKINNECKKILHYHK